MARPAFGTRGRRLARLAAVAAAIACCGCGYSLRAPYDPTIRTVYVPVFRSFTFREDVNLRLTEEVIKEIERRTPYRVVGDPDEADAILSGTVLYTSNMISVVSPINLPREVIAELTAEVTLEDVRPGAETDAPPPVVRVTEPMKFYPELGETASLGLEKSIRKMARDIVNMMEERW